MTQPDRHEINNLLAAVMAEAQLLQMDRLTPDQAAALDRIVASTRRLRDLLRAPELPAPEPAAE